MKPFSLYIHIPFCLHKCPYCDFNTYALAGIPEREYLAALLSELDYRATLPEWRGREVQSIYFGGGTPSLFKASSIARIVAAISGLFPVHDHVEISLEANPGTLDTDYLGDLRRTGINRLSIGTQSFNRELLKVLGRMHSPEQNEAAVAAARAAGFRNLSLDLLYSVPGQTLDLWEADIEAAISLSPDHISAYGLTIEKGTPFYQSYKRGLLKLPVEDVLVEMMELVNSALPEAGFAHYEISNFAKSGKEARHNMAYWNGDDYLGLGAGAHSFLSAQPGDENFGRRWSNYALPNRYMKEAVAGGKADSWSDTLDRNDAIFEFFFLGLRKNAGVNMNLFEERFGLKVRDVYPFVLDMLTEQELVSVKTDTFCLTTKGILLADSVIEHFAVIDAPQPIKQAANL